MLKKLTVLLVSFAVGIVHAQSFTMTHDHVEIVVQHKDTSGKFSVAEMMKLREILPQAVEKYCKGKDCSRLNEERIEHSLKYKENLPVREVRVREMKKKS